MDEKLILTPPKAKVVFQKDSKVANSGSTNVVGIVEMIASTRAHPASTFTKVTAM